MVQTRSRSNPKAVATPEATTAPSASNKATSSKRKNAPAVAAAAAPAAKASKAEGTADVAEAKAASSEANSAAVTANGGDAVESAAASSSSSAAAPPALEAPATATIPAPVEVPTFPASTSVVASDEEPTAHHAKEDHTRGVIHPYEVVVSDIEGTTTPIVFVKENLVSHLFLISFFFSRTYRSPANR